MLAANPVAPTLTSSPTTNVPSVTKPEIVFPRTLVTVNLEPETVPVKVLPTLGKIPLIFVNVRSLVQI